MNDTPGPVDFASEGSRSPAVGEGALLVVYGLPVAEPERVIAEIEDIIGIDASDAIRVSAKTGEGVDDVLEAVIARIPPPQGDPGAPLQALVIDSWFDNYVGVVMLVRLMQGTLRPKDRILLMATSAA